jgi:hypothetical protein
VYDQVETAVRATIVQLRAESLSLWARCFGSARRSNDDARLSGAAVDPFVGQNSVLPEIWTVGLRNPWRWSFDDVRRGGTGALVIADVGQNAWEEIDYQPPATGGLNFGWRIREGAHSHVTSAPAFSTPLRDPIWEYSQRLAPR